MCQCVNRITLIGFLGDAPELRFSQKGNPVGTFSLAVEAKRTPGFSHLKQ